MVELVLLLPLLIVVGSVAGILAGLLGVGGGIVLVPALYFIFIQQNVSPASAIAIATGTSLMTIIPTSLSAIYAQHHRKNIDWSLVTKWAVGLFTGSMCGAALFSVTNNEKMTTIFGLIALVVAMNMLFNISSKITADSLPSLVIQRLLGFVVGALSSMAGIGGGTLSVPILTAYQLPVHHAVACASVYGFFIAVPSAIVMFFLPNTPSDAPLATFGFINIAAVIVIVPLTVLFAPLGVALGQRINARVLKRLFAVFLFFTSLKMLHVI